jgi:hypothetical protein
MSFTTLEQGALITRDAHVAVSALKELVDSAEHKIRVAEREAVGLAIGRFRGHDPVEILRDVAETLRSSTFEVAVSEARNKTETALA